MGEEGLPTYQHTVLCQTSLPYRRTAERVLERRNGYTMLRVEAGTAYSEREDAWVELAPTLRPKSSACAHSPEYGSDRHPVQCHRCRRQHVGLFQSGLSPRRGESRELNGREIRAMKEQVSALAAAEMRFAAGGRVQKQGRAAVISEFDLWFPKASNQRILWPSTVTLSLDYYQSLVNHAVPLDPRAVAALSHSAMGLDIYAWLSQRLCRIHPQTEAFVPWVSLQGQFGTNYRSIRKFRQVFLKTLRDVLTQYPQAQLRPNSKGLHLRQSPPPISRKELCA